MLKSFAALLFSASAVFAQANPTAYDALRTVGNQVNRDFVNRVVSVTGVDGNPQPSTWRIFIDDPNARGGIREVEVTDGRSLPIVFPVAKLRARRKALPSTPRA